MSGGKRIYEQLKGSFIGGRSHELLVFCFFLAVSFGFWLLQALNETLVREVQVALELDNVPDEVVIIDSLPSTLSVTLNDRGVPLARHSIYSLFRPNLVTVDFTKLDTKHNEAEIYISASEMQRMLGRIFSPTTKIQAIRPDTIRFSFNHGLSRKLPVRLAGSLRPSLQNYIQSVRLEPDSVRVFAPASVLDTMRTVYTESFLMDDLTEAGSYQIGLRRQKLLKYEPSRLNMKVSVGYYTEKSVRVPILGLNFPADRKLRTFPAQATITFRVESGRFHKVTAEDFVLATTYEELLSESEDSKLLLHLKTVPEGVSDVRITPQEVDYLIEKVVQETDN